LTERPNILIVGASGHAKVIIDIVEQQGSFQIFGLIDSFKQPGTTLMGYQVIGKEDSIPPLLATRNVAGGIIAIGHNWIRHQMANRIREIAPDFLFVNAIHPSAHIAREVGIGRGVVMMAGVSINPGTRIADFCYFNTNASVDHDNIIEEFSCLQPNAATGGNVRVGAFSSISIGANVIHGVTIGSHSVVGAGSTVISDVADGVVAYGTPCREIRKRRPEDNYY
jgi:sugar O-acyltransferase (sialic acid O-acetyltransferase NeuD family)